MKNTIALCAFLALTAGQSMALVANFDSKDTGPNNYYRPTTDGSYDWSDGGATFNMNVTYGGVGWDGFTYSDVNDTVTSGSENQYAVYGTGKDNSGTGVYAVAYAGATPTVSFSYAQTVNGFYAHNTTYAALDMHNGSSFSKAFSTNDWFKLTIEGKDSGGSSQGTVDFMLADFTGYTGDEKDNYMTTAWTWVDLTSLGDNVSSLEFSMSSSDNGSFGMNTPAYFAMDELQAVPEPASALLIALGSFGIFGYRRYKKHLGM